MAPTTIIGVALFLMCTPAALLDFAIPSWKSDPAVRIEDAYKWTYQATRGGEHAVPDTDSARKWLDGEWQTLGAPAANEPVWEPLCPGGEIGRLNLRPFKSRGGHADELLDAFLASSRDYRSESKAFKDAWFELGKRLRGKTIGTLDRRAWVKLNAEMRARNYPAIHHSEQYEQAEQPAYRILTKAEMQKLLATLK